VLPSCGQFERARLCHMIYERIGWRYMGIVNPEMYAEILAGMQRGSVTRMQCLDYIRNCGWLLE
jgi:hypothetical protein